MPVESNEDKKSVAYLRQLGLTTDEISAYLYLLGNGPQTVLALSRGINTGRTKLYPLLDQLANKQLVDVHERSYGTTYQAADPSALEFLVTEQETHAALLRSQLPATLHSLTQTQNLSPASVGITEYTNIDDVKRLYQGIVEVSSEYRAFELPSVKKRIGKYLTDKIESNNSLKTYILTNQKGATLPAKHLNPAVFKIEQYVIVYDSVVLIIDPNMSAVKIQSTQLAKNYTKLFNMLYNQ